MITDADREQISKEVANVFYGLDLDDVADILKIQLAMLVTQGAESPEDAIRFLNEIRDQTEEVIRSVQIGEADRGGDSTG